MTSTPIGFALEASVTACAGFHVVVIAKSANSDVKASEIRIRKLPLAVRLVADQTTFASTVNYTPKVGGVLTAGIYFKTWLTRQAAE